MSFSTYEIEVKSAALTPYDILHTPRDRFRIFSGIVIAQHKCSISFSLGTHIMCYIPPSLLSLRQEDDKLIASVPEEFLIIKPQDISFELSSLGIASIFKTLNALHYSLSVLENESILIINPPNSISIQICLSLGLTVFYYAKEDYKNKGIKILDIPDLLVSETAGLGVDNILDYSVNHDNLVKKSIIDCLGVHGKWAVCDENLQLDPPETAQLFMRNASIRWFNENIWLNSGTSHGKFLHLLNKTVKYLRDGYDLRPYKSFFFSEISAAYSEICDLILLKTS